MTIRIGFAAYLGVSHELPSAMKAIEFIPPAVAIAVAAVWLGSQSRSISSLVGENTLLRERLEEARQASFRAEKADHAAPLLPAGKDGAKRKIDWKHIALNQTGPSDGGVEDIRKSMQLRSMLLELSSAELVNGLDSLGELDLPAAAKRQLEEALIEVLAEKDPGLAVERLGSRMDDERMSWQLGNSFRMWAEKDPGAALAWMDKQLAEGKFESKTLDGKSELRMRCEGGLVAALLQSDPAAATARVQELPEDQRASLFNQGIFFRMKPGTELAVADLIRNSVPEKERLSTLGNTGGLLVHQGGFERVGAFLSKIDGSKEERESVVSAAVRNNSHRMDPKPGALAEGMETNRTWIRKEAPEALDRITGNALAEAASRGRFEEAAQLAEKYHGESGNDEVLVPLLQNTFVQANNRDRVMQLVDKVSDETKRNEIRQQLEKRGPATPQPTR